MIVVPVTGYPASGKTTLVRQLSAVVPEVGFKVLVGKRPAIMGAIKELTEAERMGHRVVIFEWNFEVHKMRRVNACVPNIEWLLAVLDVPFGVCRNRLALERAHHKEDFYPSALYDKCQKLATEVMTAVNTGTPVCMLPYPGKPEDWIRKLMVHIRTSLKLEREKHESE